MSALSRAQRSMRIIALPLTKVKSPPDPSLKANSVFNTNRMLIYYHCNIVSPHGADSDQPWTKRILKKMSTKAADVWANFGKAPEGSWKLRVYEYGERIVDRIDFEELALKSVDPSMGPSSRTPNATEYQPEKLAQGSESSSRVSEVPLVYPPSVYPQHLGSSMHPALAPLRTLVNSREPRHRRGFYLWMIIAPFTAPFVLIPVIPNLPFFFCAWRSWSHYRAYRSSQYLSSLLDHGLIVPQPSAELDQLYASFAKVPHISEKPHSPASLTTSSSEHSKSKSTSTASGTHSRASSSSETSSPGGDSHHPPQRLLTRKAIPQILNLFDLPQSAAADMYRAVEQVRGRLGKQSRF
ncbi:mitochondrial K+-H+ exchange-related-domain-containing protein [Phlebopus sp. FC_14]|nr:mitochondrial K+-H+ exchange-related-domain-containing protein [Phlebopus sp. FC_14]